MKRNHQYSRCDAEDDQSKRKGTQDQVTLWGGGVLQVSNLGHPDRNEAHQKEEREK